MAFWLFKTEAETFSWEMQKQRGAKVNAPDGDAHAGHY